MTVGEKSTLLVCVESIRMYVVTSCLAAGVWQEQAKGLTENSIYFPLVDATALCLIDVYNGYAYKC